MYSTLYQTAFIVQIRYNTDSNGVENAWRLIMDGKEILVNHIDIRKQCKTSCDWLEDKKAFKHHITIHNCIVQIDGNNNAVIS